MKPTNLLFLFSDYHQRDILGCYGNNEESCGVPLVMAGPDVPAGRTVQTPVSLVDIFPTVMEATGVELTPTDADLPGESLWGLADGPDRARTVFSEYHAAGSRHGAYMLCDGHTKYVHYLHEPAQLFDLDEDPQERHNLAASPEHRSLELEFESRLRALVDVEAVDRMAKEDQRAKVEAFGGEEAVLARGLSNSAIPGEAPVFQRLSR